MKKNYFVFVWKVLIFYCWSVRGADIDQEWCSLDVVDETGVQPAIAFTYKISPDKIGFEVNISTTKDVQTCRLLIQKEDEQPRELSSSSNHSDRQGWKMLKHGKVLKLTRTVWHDKKIDLEGKYSLIFENNETALFFVVSPETDFKEEIPTFYTERFTFESNNNRFRTCV